MAGYMLQDNGGRLSAPLQQNPAAGTIISSQPPKLVKLIDYMRSLDLLSPPKAPSPRFRPLQDRDLISEMSSGESSVLGCPSEL